MNGEFENNMVVVVEKKKRLLYSLMDNDTMRKK